MSRYYRHIDNNSEKTSMENLDKSIGGKNRYTFWCPAMEQRRFYGSCLCLKASYEAGRIRPDDPFCDCARAMESGNCVALRMREEEMAAGRALYYQDPDSRPGPTLKEGEENIASYRRGWEQVGRIISGVTKTVRRVVTTEEKIEPAVAGFEIKGMDIASLITEAAAEENRKASINDELRRIKLEVVKIAKTNPVEAKRLITEAKQLQQQLED